MSEWPTYKSIKDHTEALRIEFNPKIISYSEILTRFFDEQGGPPASPSYSRQYRSAIFVHNEDQRFTAEGLIHDWSMKRRGKKIFTDVEEATPFYKAEEYHQKYFEKHRAY